MTSSQRIPILHEGPSIHKHTYTASIHSHTVTNYHVSLEKSTILDRLV